MRSKIVQCVERLIKEFISVRKIRSMTSIKEKIVQSVERLINVFISVKKNRSMTSKREI